MANVPTGKPATFGKSSWYSNPPADRVLIEKGKNPILDPVSGATGNGVLMVGSLM